MKAQYLKKLLGTERPVADYGEHIGIGSDYRHDLISINKDTDIVTKKFHVKDGDLPELYEKVKELIRKEEWEEIKNGEDEIDNPVILYYENNGKIIPVECSGEEYPSTTKTGEMVYNNKHFRDKNKAINNAIKGYEQQILSLTERIAELDESLRRIEKRKEHCIVYLNKIKNIKE